MSTEELIQALDMYLLLTDLQKRLISETNGHFITLCSILRISSSTGIEGNFIFSGGFISTEGFNTVLRNLTNRGLSNRLLFPQGHIISFQRCFIRGVSAYLDFNANIMDNSQEKMSKTRAKEQITDNAQTSWIYTNQRFV